MTTVRSIVNEGINMAVVEANDKQYETITIEKDPYYDDMKKAIKIVIEFIKTNKLIIYGGTAIDYSLRLFGDCIYSDASQNIPDLDFYSSSSIEHSYQLADLLFKAGFAEARAIRALYVRVMKLDVIDRHWVADISYCPPNIFKNIPTILYNGILCVHPHFQYIDIHNSLSFPFDQAPREVIFNRISKDIQRYNKLYKYYPIIADTNKYKLELITVNIKNANELVFNGLASYSILFHAYQILCTRKGIVDSSTGIIPAIFKHEGDQITFSCVDNTIDVVSFDYKKLLSLLQPETITKYAAVISIQPKRIEGMLDNKAKLIIWSTKHKMISINTLIPDKTSKHKYRFVGVQYLLKYFLQQYFIQINPNIPDKNIYLALYVSTLKMMSIVDINFIPDFSKYSLESLFYPTINVYGDSNEDDSYKVLMRKTLIDIHERRINYIMPANYYPNRGKSPPTFNYESSAFFIKDGRKITKHPVDATPNT